MKRVYKNILASISNKEKLLAVLIDPDKMPVDHVAHFIDKVNQSVATHIFVGGSTVAEDVTESLIIAIKTYTKLPVLIFPGDVNQISKHADALLFLSLISGRNPEYLIGKHVTSIPQLRATNLEVISTGYILIENGRQTAVERVTKTKPIPRTDLQVIIDTAKAGELLGMKWMYLEAGSGALHPITPQIIRAVKQELSIPLIVGGGIRSKAQLDEAYHAGADLVVIGTAFENDITFFDELKSGR